MSSGLKVPALELSQEPLMKDYGVVVAAGSCGLSTRRPMTFSDMHSVSRDSTDPFVRRGPAVRCYSSQHGRRVSDVAHACGGEKIAARI
jgi:hypothetical protein